MKETRARRVDPAAFAALDRGSLRHSDRNRGRPSLGRIAHQTANGWRHCLGSGSCAKIFSNIGRPSSSSPPATISRRYDRSTKLALSPSGSHSSRSCRLASPIRFRSHPGPFFPSAAEVRFLALLARPQGPTWNGGKGSTSAPLRRNRRRTTGTLRSAGVPEGRPNSRKWRNRPVAPATGFCPIAPVRGDCRPS